MRPVTAVIFGLLLAALCAATLPAHADVYRWVDANGKVHYSDTPPPEGAQKTQIKSGRDSQPSPAQQAKSANPADTAQKPADAGAAQAQLQQKQCELARATLQAYQSDATLVRKDADGNKHVLTADEKAKEIDKAKQQVKAACGD